MKYKLLSVPSNDNVNNIGDYVQALAASQYLPSVDGFISRESLSDYDGEESTVIMNGWFMHHPSNWPPSSHITPLFIAFHLNNSAKDEMLTDQGVAYLKEKGPIGCRDMYTKSLLESKGIKAYFSGCLTLTLGKKFKSEEHNGGCYVVDPIIPRNTDLKSLLLDICCILKHISGINQISKKLKVGGTLFNRMVLASRFVRLYSKLIDYNTLKNATYISHESTFYSTHFKTEFDKLKEAERLVDIYSKATMVITKRIHCALPCLGLNTPVYYIAKTEEEDEFINRCRLDGLLSLFNVLICTKKGLKTTFPLNGKLSTYNLVPNKADWELLANKMESLCESFICKTL